jgi:hypothetical protein
MRYVAEVTAVKRRTCSPHDHERFDQPARRIPVSALATMWSRVLPKLRECFATRAIVGVRTRFDVRTGL